MSTGSGQSQSPSQQSAQARESSSAKAEAREREERAPAGGERAEGSGSGHVGSATQRELDRNRRMAEEREQADLEAIEAQHAATEAHRNEFEEGDRGLVRRQREDAERIMRLPTPQALEELGAVVGDPTRGPSS